MIREATEALIAGQSLTQAEAVACMTEIMEGQVTPAQLAGFLIALRIKGETVEEIAGFAQVMREKALRVPFDGPTVDTCGTGGDGSGTFNISTAAAFVVAGAGLTVAKHGNRAASSQSGSADVLEALGVKLELTPEQVAACLSQVGIGFMFAQAFHPSMRHAGPTRRELGTRTVFNILGPLTNPAGAQAQVLGVGSAALLEKMAAALQRLGSRHALVVHSSDGLDEFSISAPTQVYEVHGEHLRSYMVQPEDVGLTAAPRDAVKGGTPQDNARMLRAVLQGERGPLRDVVVLNASAALVAGDAVADLREGIALAQQAIDAGRALEKLEGLISASQSFA